MSEHSEAKLRKILAALDSQKLNVWQALELIKNLMEEG